LLTAWIVEEFYNARRRYALLALKLTLYWIGTHPAVSWAEQSRSRDRTKRGNDMRQKIGRVIIALGFLAGLSGPAMAGPFSCLPGSFLSIVDIPDFTGTPGPYGQICVTLVDSTHATIQAEALPGFLMAGNQTLGLNVNSTSFTAGAVTGDGGPYTANYFPIPPIDGFGNFSFVLDTFDGPANGSTFLTFTLTDNVGSWPTVSNVLAPNLLGYDAAMKICTAAACLGFAAERGGSVVPQPAPEPGMLGLLAIGLLAWGLPALRRRKS
jgi:hypothetical protein